MYNTTVHNETVSIPRNVSQISKIGIVISNTGTNRMWDKVDVENQFHNTVNINYSPNSASQLLAFDKSRRHTYTYYFIKAFNNSKTEVYKL